MFRGFFSGGVLGLVVSGLALGTASLVGETPAGGRPPLAPQVEPPGLAEGSGDIVGNGSDPLPGGASDPGGAPAPSETPEVAVPDAEPALPDADTASPVAPTAEELGQGMAPPAAEASLPDVIAGAEAPVLPNPLARAPEPPVAEALVDIPSDPVSPPPSDTPPAQPQAAPDAPEETVILLDPELPAPAPVIVDIAPSDAPDTSAEPDLVAGAEPAARPQAETESVTDQPVVAEQTAPPVLPDAPEAGRSEAPGDAPAMADPSAEEPAPVAVVETTPEAVPEPPSPPAEPEAPTEAPAEPRIALQGGETSLPGRTDAVRVIRPGTEEPAAEAVDPVAEPTLSEDAPALERFAATYDNPEGKPLMSIILIDDGGLGAGAVAAVRSVPFPVTVALDALAADADAKMAAYRAAGIEVMALAVLPEGAQPSDVEITLEAAFAALPESIALLDAGNGGLQSDRAVTEQAMARLAQDGRGFITQSRGLNMALRSAEAASVPAAVIYRDLDSEDQDARVIRRFMDQAAFRARQQSGVVLVGRVRADTISALSLWGTANRAEQVVLAPASATLLSQD